MSHLNFSIINFCPLKCSLAMLNETFSVIVKHREFVQVPDKHIRLSLAPHARDPDERRFFKSTVSLFNGKYLLHVSARQRLIVWKNHWVIFGVGLVTSFFHPLSVSWNFWTIPTNIKAWKEEEKKYYVQVHSTVKSWKNWLCIHLPIHIHFWTSINYPIGQFFSAASAYNIMKYKAYNWTWTPKSKVSFWKKALFTYINNYSPLSAGSNFGFPAAMAISLGQ